MAVAPAVGSSDDREGRARDASLQRGRFVFRPVSRPPRWSNLGVPHAVNNATTSTMVSIYNSTWYVWRSAGFARDCLACCLWGWFVQFCFIYYKSLISVLCADLPGHQIFFKHGVRLVEAAEIQLEALGRPATYAVFVLPYL